MSDIDTAAVDGLKALDSDRPIREADMSGSGLLPCNLTPESYLSVPFRCCLLRCTLSQF